MYITTQLEINPWTRYFPSGMLHFVSASLHYQHGSWMMNNYSESSDKFYGINCNAFDAYLVLDCIFLSSSIFYNWLMASSSASCLLFKFSNAVLWPSLSSPTLLSSFLPVNFQHVPFSKFSNICSGSSKAELHQSHPLSSQYFPHHTSFLPSLGLPQLHAPTCCSGQPLSGTALVQHLIELS